ncbi:MAG: hypothetical protein HY472_00550 [Candidatus Sungbacteria bacterium]|nr:hypothetical protein [Candidatus Sungbacteria bacterium]
MNQELKRRVEKQRRTEQRTMLNTALLFLAFLILSAFSFPFSTFYFLLPTSYAQFIPEPVSLVAEPGSPSPGETIAIRAETPTFDPRQSEFFWTVNGAGRPDLSGRGKNSISANAGDIGSVVRVSVNVRSSDGGDGSASLALRVSDSALAWFAETYTPPWYKGKALPSRDSVVSFVAIPRIVVGGSQVPVQSITYRWRLDNQDDALVGTGERVFRIRTSDLPRTTHRVSVLMEDPASGTKREEEVFIIPTEPRVVIYPATPLGGVETRSAAAFSFGRGTLDFQAEPFFFPVIAKSDLSYEWNFGASAVSGSPRNPWLITIEAGEDTTGAFALLATVRKIGEAILFAMKSITLFVE